MDSLFLFTAVIMLVFGVLQIILFFKVLGMTNNVKKIQDKMDYPFNTRRANFDYDFMFYLYNNKKNEARDLLLKTMWDGYFIPRMIRAENKDKFDENYSRLKNEYGKYFDMLGEEFPSYDNIRNNIK